MTEYEALLLIPSRASVILKTDLRKGGIPGALRGTQWTFCSALYSRERVSARFTIYPLQVPAQISRASIALSVVWVNEVFWDVEQ